MQSLTAKQIIKVLKKNGFVLSRQRGSHLIFRHFELKMIVPVSLHGGNQPIPLGTFLAIIKQSKIPKKEFKK